MNMHTLTLMRGFCVHVTKLSYETCEAQTKNCDPSIFGMILENMVSCDLGTKQEGFGKTQIGEAHNEVEWFSVTTIHDIDRDKEEHLDVATKYSSLTSDQDRCYIIDKAPNKK